MKNEFKTTTCKRCKHKIHPEGANGALLAYDDKECMQCHEELYWLKRAATGDTNY